MIENASTIQTRRKARSLEEAIAYQQEKLRQLQNKQRDQQRRERARNQRAIMQWMKAEGLDAIPAEKWKIACSKIKGLLMAHSEKTAQPCRPVDVSTSERDCSGR